ncbi:MFS transporter [Enteractinococcus coprophilus]|uniref:DHA2 family multidrug resistance protein-like MFS transporter n=1 Tax=Enteractinococcus coprophilus TaxID=1027633 RepID=A0A543ANX0_9MICC|nr:MFS transporter [Enteractinococcus coprophilus]TQL74280.1 DHA2 family multidrug resistance protein-like MFS transporter [Enteractinococcus coprophilus]
MNPRSPSVFTSRQRWMFLAVISAALFLVGADNSILYTALPELRDQLGTTPLEGLWIINAYPLVLSGLLLGTGTLGDRIGHRLMFLVGVAIFGLGSLLAAFSPTAWLLIAARGLLGVGAATMMPSSLALVRITFTDVRERNMAIAVWMSVAVVGAATGPVLGGLLLEFFWWGSVFLINVPIALATLLAVVAIAPPNIPNPHKQWDLVSSIWAMFAMLGMVTAIKELANPNRAAWLLIAATVVGLIGLLLFIFRQRVLEQPLLDAQIFRSRIFTGGVVTAAVMMFVVAGLELMTTQRFQTAGGFTPLQAGALVATVAVPSIPAALLGGAFLHRVGFIPLISGGFAVLSLGIGLAWWTFRFDSLVPFIASLLLVGIGSGFASSVASTAILGAAPLDKAGMASSVESVSYEFGTLISVAVFGSLLPFFYALGAPDAVAGDVDHGVEHPVHGPAAIAAYDDAYLLILLILTAVAALAAVVTAYCFRGNPKEAGVDAPQ